MHLSVNPNPRDKWRGFYFDFVRKNGVGTKTLTKYFWTGHIPNPTDQASFSVQYYKDKYTSETLHSIVCIMPGDVTQGYWFTNKPESTVRKEYKYTLLHETSHQFDAPDHYCFGTNCSNQYCWVHHPELMAESCIMRYRYNVDGLNINKLYCPRCVDTIFNHLVDHHR